MIETFAKAAVCPLGPIAPRLIDQIHHCGPTRRDIVVIENVACGVGRRVTPAHSAHDIRESIRPKAPEWPTRIAVGRISMMIEGCESASAVVLVEDGNAAFVGWPLSRGNQSGISHEIEF